MAFNYPPSVLLILVALIVTGAARSLMVRTLFQMGYEHPLLVTLLYLLGQALALPLHWILSRMNKEKGNESSSRPTSGTLHDIQEEDGSDSSQDNCDEEAGIQSSKTDTKPDAVANGNQTKDKGTARLSSAHQDKRFFEIEESSKSLRSSTSSTKRPARPTLAKASGSNRYSSTARNSSSRHMSTSFRNSSMQSIRRKSSVSDLMVSVMSGQGDVVTTSDFFMEDDDTPDEGSAMMNLKTPTNIDTPLPARTVNRMGSVTGLSSRSQEASERLLNAVPVWARPIIPSIFNLLHAIFRIVALLYVAASVNEMFISGTELLLSVLMARFIRKRQVSLWRWGGVFVVSLGLVIIVVGTLLQPVDEDDDNDEGSSAPQWLGFVLLLAKCLAAGMQDISEEIFMQEGDIPAALLLGIEGCIGLLIGIPLYFGLAGFLGENPIDALRDLFGSGLIFGLAFATVLVFATAGIFNLVASAVTSSMTRNVWKNFRPLLVWAVGLIIFYASVDVAEDDRVGEAWVVPKSYFLLAGFAVIAGGVGVYYVDSGKAAESTESTTDSIEKTEDE